MEMPCSTFLIGGKLVRFLPPLRRDGSLLLPVAGRPAVKDRIESLGVPHTEVGSLLINGRAAALSTRLDGGETVEVLPWPGLQPIGESPPRFILDAHLGRLARRLRLLGLDCAYRPDIDDPELIAQAVAEQRIVLTRDVGVLKHSAVRLGAFVYHTDLAGQLRELFLRFGLRHHLHPFSRCSQCNDLLVPSTLEAVRDRVPARVQAWQTRYFCCQGCHQVYWEGSHVERIRAEVSRTLAAEED